MMKLAVLSLAFFAGAVTAKDNGENLGELGLTAMIRHQPQHHPDVFSHALQLVGEMDSAPSCHRLATATLIKSCQSLNPVDSEGRKSSNVGLDLVKSAFAARLAVCELMGAHAAVPQPCRAMIPQKPTKSGRGFRCLLPGHYCSQDSKIDIAKQSEYEEVGQEETAECLASLESRPQWWTSYSNARQNAIAICHAARTEIEKDELLDIHRSMAAATSDVDQALAESAQRAQAHASEHQQFLFAARNLQLKILKEFEEGEAKAQSVFNILLRSLERGLDSILRSFSSKASDASLHLQELDRGSLRKFQRTFIWLTCWQLIKVSSYQHDRAAEKAQQVVQEIDELTAKQAAALTTYHETTLAMQVEVAAARDREMGRFGTIVEAIQDHLQRSSEAMSHIYKQQLFHGAWLTKLESTFQGLQSVALAIQQNQEWQAANQTAMMASLQSRVEVMENALQSTTDRMLKLGAAIDEKTSLVSALNMFSRAEGAIKAIAYLAVVLYVGRVNIKAATLLVFGIVIVYIATSFSIIEKGKEVAVWLPQSIDTSNGADGSVPVSLQLIAGLLFAAVSTVSVVTLIRRLTADQSKGPD